MPSPVGHSLAAVAVGWIVARPAPMGRALAVQAGILTAVALAPDLDLLIGRHSRETHSIGAAVIVASVAAVMRWPVAVERWRIFLAVLLVYLSHPLLDALSPDMSAPFGVMAFWPFSSTHVTTGVHIFMPIWRRWWVSGFVPHTILAVSRELAIMVPVAWFVWWKRRPRT
jgi:membrane-bound metal-dependent hydrolase YbcI (DUF457 family)